jgi:5'-methylthioadenosine phosphorylase
MSNIAIIGGSGLYDIEGISVKEELTVNTPFGKTSGAITSGTLEGKNVFFLPRHGRHHTINPSEINYRANIYALKSLGVDAILSVSACGSLREELKPLDFVIPAQFVDRTNQARKHTFFEDGAVAHVSLANPVCPCLVDSLVGAAKKAGVVIHHGQTYLNMEGPQFSTFAESTLYRSWGMDIIGMTNMAEARLAREAQICFVTLAAVTDYDCWHPSHESVSVEAVIEVMNKNVVNSKKIIREFAKNIKANRKCTCSQSLKYALLTKPDHIREATKKKLGVIMGEI